MFLEKQNMSIIELVVLLVVVWGLFAIGDFFKKKRKNKRLKQHEIQDKDPMETSKVMQDKDLIEASKVGIWHFEGDLYISTENQSIKSTNDGLFINDKKLCTWRELLMPSCSIGSNLLNLEMYRVTPEGLEKKTIHVEFPDDESVERFLNEELTEGFNAWVDLLATTDEKEYDKWLNEIEKFKA